MASFKITGQMKVKTLKEQFMNNFGTVLRVYYHHRFADDNVTLASIRGEGAVGGELDCGENDIVGDFEEFMMELYGIEVQVASPDDSYLVNNSLRLGEVKNVAKAISENGKQGKSKFVFNGQEYALKGRLVHAVVKHFIEENPNVTIETLDKTFNVTSRKFVTTPVIAMTTTDSSGKAGGNYYMNPEDFISIINNQIVVWNYWPMKYFSVFMDTVKKIGYSVEEV
ncbi:MAG: hypothetical protein IK004_01710 [Bacteroidales bacterium]|nr:hypothetical protein [Bacteroidales bacterium]